MKPEIGKYIGGTIYIHRLAADRLPDRYQHAFSTALEILENRKIDWNVVRISNEKVAFLKYREFDETPFPELVRSTLVDILRRKIRQTDYSNHENPPILHRKELLLSPQFPNRHLFENLTQQLENAGAFNEANKIGYKKQWEEKLKSLGIEVVENNVVKTSAAPTSDVSRHKTALARYEFSQPVKLLLRHNLLNDARSFFDYGCGQGDDVNGLAKAGFEAQGWDPYFNSETALIRSDVVNLGFVLNVIENPSERSKALKKAWRLAKNVLSIAVMTPNSLAIENTRPYGDGFLTTRGTFQKYFTQQQARQYIEDTIAETPIAIAAGIFFVFKDKISEQNFLLERYNRHRLRALPLFEIRDRRSEAVKLDKIDALKPELEALSAQILDHGRFLFPEEVPQELSDAFRSQNVSLKRAEQLCNDILLDRDEFEQARQARIEDLSLYFAMEMFSSRKQYRELPKTLQNDIRLFFGSHAEAMIAAKELLFSAGNSGLVQDACETFCDEGLGYIVGNDQMMFHSSALEKLPPILRCFVACSEVLYGDVSVADLIKIHISSGKLTLQFYEDFSKPLPVLKQRVKIDMRALRVNNFEQEEADRQFLYLKSLYLPEDHPDYEDQSRFDRALMKLGLFDFSGYGPSTDEFERTLYKNGLNVQGFDIRPLS